jgi:hypothetical protein
MGFGLVIEFIEQLEIVTISNYSTIANSLQHVLSVLSLLCLHQSLPGDGSQQCPLLPCSRSYWFATVAQLSTLNTTPFH